MIEKLIVFVEEYSMEVALEELLPMLLDGVDFQIIRFQCKDDLLKKAPTRLKGYASWLPESWRILVLVDRDDDNCVELKAELEGMAAAAGLRTKTSVGNGRSFQVVNRIAVEELEAWFFGDWTAVQAAYPRVPANLPQKAPFRDPDAILGGTWEALERVLKLAGYFSTGLRKLELARSVASHMDPAQNKSRSFQAFVDAVEAAKM
ncbi:hypothetical protein WI80_00080 [Burkholderia ubonensis]|uniref:DUF4276 family protein n=1 Tax=Burkholderia ubonensis TaxID=101571 RepID=UPI00075E857F|nr:DUF4276 family protein [Burkholderia ubonensis]KVD16058.1 hypothetical protein WI80_00080 [Burkholderia ubonensis]KVU24926.1 hypothetical protein WK63_25370 [Burkholderia ubonensis]